MRIVSIILLFLCGCSNNHDLYDVISVSDGDTITVLDQNKNQHKVRLLEIDAPEKKQAFGQKSKQNLSDKVFGQKVKLVGSKTDRYGRWLRIVYVNDRCINLEMVQEGFAWQYQRFSKNKVYQNAEAFARSQKLGLWTDKHPIPPWEFRKHHVR